MKRNNRAWMCVMTACLAAVLALSAAPAAQAHGDELLRGEVDKLTRYNPPIVHAYGGTDTQRVHRRIYVRTCIQLQWGPPIYDWVTIECARDSRPRARAVVVGLSIDCNMDTYYRARVRGWTRTSSGRIGHRELGFTDRKYINCPG